MTTRINVSVPDEMKRWLDQHAQLNPSGLLQSAIQREMRKEFNVKEHGISIEGSPDANVAITANVMCACGYLFGVEDGQRRAKCPFCGSMVSLPDEWED